MFRIKAKNGNVIDIEDRDHALRAVGDGHEVLTFDADDKGSKPKKWDPEAEADAADGGSE